MSKNVCRKRLHATHLFPHLVVSTVTWTSLNSRSVSKSLHCLHFTRFMPGPKSACSTLWIPSGATTDDVALIVWQRLVVAQKVRKNTQTMPRVRTRQLALNWQAQSFQQDKHEDKRSGINMNNQRREEEEEEPYVQCLGKHKRRGRRQAPSGAHKSREETKKEDERKTKDASTTRCVHINTVSPASNPDTLTIGLKQEYCNFTNFRCSLNFGKFGGQQIYRN